MLCFAAGAMPSVVAGLVRCPVIALPTSVGYGAAFGKPASIKYLMLPFHALSYTNLLEGQPWRFVGMRIES